MRAGLLLLVLLLVTGSASAATPRIRGTSARENALIRETLVRSETARALAAALEGTDVIAYVQLTTAERAGRASTRFVVSAGAHRFVRILIGAMTPPRDRLALLAHELQHALEIGRARDVRDVDGLRRLYQRIGEDPSAAHSFETAEARQVFTKVRRELARTPAQSPSSLAGCALGAGVPASGSLASAGCATGGGL